MEYDFSEFTFYRSNLTWNSKVKVIQCSKCGEKSIVLKNNRNYRCIYCGNDYGSILDEFVEVGPEEIIKFNIDKDTAVKNVKEDLEKNSIFIPGKLKKTFKVENIQEFYMHYWSYNLDICTKYKAKVGDKYDIDDGKSYRCDYKKYDRVDIFKIRNRLICDSNIFKKEGEKILPYDMKKLVEFREEDISNIGITKVNKGAEICFAETEKIINEEIKNKVRKNLNGLYDEVILQKVNSSCSNGNYKLILLPVYSIEYRYNNKKYTALINGQSGKVYVDYPLSILKVIIAPVIVLLVAYFIVTGGYL